MTTKPTVKVGDLTVPLKMPDSIAARYDVLVAYNKSPARAAHAALALAWSGPRRPRTPMSYDACDYGGRVMDELCGRGVHPVESMAAALKAFNFVTADLVTGMEVDEREGNSEAPADSITS